MTYPAKYPLHTHTTYGCAACGTIYSCRLSPASAEDVNATIVADLTAALATAQEDSARLDWVEAERAKVGPIGFRPLDEPGPWPWQITTNPHGKTCAPLREAIDAARAAGPATPTRP